MIIQLKKIVIWLVDLFPDGIFLIVANLILRGKGVGTMKKMGKQWELTSQNVSITLSKRHKWKRYLEGIQNTCNKLAESYFFDQITLAPDDTVIDCGANIGELGIFILSKSSGINYWAFEPCELERNALERNIPPGQGKIFDCGLWKFDGQLEFFENTKNDDSSFITPPSYETTKNLAVSRLDTIASDLKRIRILKVEAEGGEPEVLEGAEGILSRVDFISVDTSPERGVSQSETTTDVINFLIFRGFRLKAIRHHPRIMCLFERSAATALGS